MATGSECKQWIRQARRGKVVGNGINIARAWSDQNELVLSILQELHNSQGNLAASWQATITKFTSSVPVWLVKDSRSSIGRIRQQMQTAAIKELEEMLNVLRDYSIHWEQIDSNLPILVAKLLHQKIRQDGDSAALYNFQEIVEQFNLSYGELGLTQKELVKLKMATLEIQDHRRDTEIFIALRSYSDEE